jgi:hypothetical protein
MTNSPLLPGVLEAQVVSKSAHRWSILLSYKPPKFHDRLAASAKAKEASVTKFKSVPDADGPAAQERQANRQAIIKAREARAEARRVAQQVREKELADAAVLQAELAAKAEHENARIGREQAEAAKLLSEKQAEEEAVVAATQKAARDARYAARKEAKKVRRRGY